MKDHVQTQAGRKVPAHFRWGVLILAGALSACAGGNAPPFQADPGIAVAKRWAAFPETEPKLVDDGWLQSFRSPMLMKLVDEALENNRDLRVAGLNVAEARSVARQAGAGLLPSATVGLGAERAGNLDDGDGVATDIEPSFRVAWEADLWGRVSGARTAAVIDAVAESAIYEYARQSLAAEVADAWILVNGNNYRLQLARAELAARQRALENIEQRVEARATLPVDGNIARSNVAVARARVALEQGELARSVRALEILLGRYPAAELKAISGMPRLPGRIPVGLPSELLERRPDIVARERQVAAAFSRKREAQAARLPRLTLSADLVGSGGSLGDALDPANIVWTLAGNLIAPLFRGGELKEEVNIRNARQERALAEYGAAALRAFQEVEDALSDDQVLARRAGLLGSALNELREAVEIEQQRYDAGEIELTRLEDARLNFYNVQRLLADVRTERLRNRVQLHLALGGSFEMPKDEAETETAAAEGAEASEG